MSDDGIGKRILLCGYFAFETSDNGGQPVKSRETYCALCKKYGKEKITYIDTLGWKKHPGRILKSFLREIKKHDYIFMLPAQNGLLVFSKLLEFSKKVFHKSIYYIVIGGWLPSLATNNLKLKKTLMLFDGIFVETNSMKELLEDLKLKNIIVMPNFKDLTPLKEDELIYPNGEPYKLCTFSRVMREKGIEDAIDAVKAVNKELGRMIYTLDIYGQIDSGYKDRFTELQKDFPEYINYKGSIPYDQSVEVLKNYFALLFPTHYYTEGVPGTIIDSYASGVPVITSLWANSKDIFIEGVTGWGYEFGKNENLKILLKKAIDNPDEFCSMRVSTLKEAEKYCPEKAIELIDRLLQDEIII